MLYASKLKKVNFYLVLIVLIQCSFANANLHCNSYTGYPHPKLVKNLFELQWRSLKSVFYNNNPLPEGFSQKDFLAETQQKELKSKLKLINEEEASRLSCIFGHLPKEQRDKLYFLAMLDTDKDGINDFLVSDYYGKFSEGDLDVDGDGILNIYDPYPFNINNKGLKISSNKFGQAVGEIPDVNKNGLPDHLDFQTLNEVDNKFRSQRSIDIQWRLFSKYKIILVERSDQTWPEKFSTALEDILSVVLRKWFAKHDNIMPALRTIAFEEAMFVSSADLHIKEENKYNYGLSTAQTNSISVYHALNDGFQGLELFGLLLHEVFHNLTAQYDYSHSCTQLSHSVLSNYNNSRTVYNSNNFVDLLKTFGWGNFELIEEPRINLSTGVPTNSRPVTFNAGGYFSSGDYKSEIRQIVSWVDWLDHLYKKYGDNYLLQNELKPFFVVNDYSMVNHYEWYSENARAAIYNLIEDGIILLCSPEEQGQAIESFRSKQQGIGFWFNYPAIKSNIKAYKHFKDIFSLQNKDLVALSKKYIGCSGKPLN